MKEIFKCSFCGAEYDTAIERAKCEIECDAKIKQQEEKEKKKKLMEEKDNRYLEIMNESKKIGEMIKAYTKDYGCFSFHSKHDGDDDGYALNTLFDKWWF